MSLCTLTNPAEIQHKVLVGNEIPILITLSTDGVKNSFDDLASNVENGFYKIPADLKTLLGRNDFNTAAVEAVLESELKRITTNGSGDDVTLGILFDGEKIMRDLPAREKERAAKANKTAYEKTDGSDNDNAAQSKEKPKNFNILG